MYLIQVIINDEHAGWLHRTEHGWQVGSIEDATVYATPRDARVERDEMQSFPGCGLHVRNVNGIAGYDEMVSNRNDKLAAGDPGR